MTSSTNRTEHAALLERALRAQGTSVRPIDTTDHPRRAGLEGPFQFADSRVLYYDPIEGRYYDAGSDIYVDHPDA